MLANRIIQANKGIGGIDQYTKLMLHMNGTNGSTTFTDSTITPKTMTASGNAQISTTQKKFGTASGFFDGTGDYIYALDSTNFYFSSGNFTIDWWQYPTASTAYGIVEQITNNDNFWSITFSPGSFKIYFIIYEAASQIGFYTWPLSPQVNVWKHYALVRSGSSIDMYENGVKLTVTVDRILSNMPDIAFSLLIGMGYDTGATRYFTGYLDEFRVSKGIARWTNNFTPPISEYTT